VRGIVTVATVFETRLRRLAAPELAGHVRGGLRGVERECLRIRPDGRIAHTPHPAGLGSALTNAFITTDYSEALLEFVTPPELTNWATVQFLCDIHHFTCAQLGDELLWPLSMPGEMAGDDDIPVARYGKSNVGTMKTVYRYGLGHRYGRLMQAIAGIHYNFSLPDAFWPAYRAAEGADAAVPDQDFRSAAYLAAVRNVRRLDWLLLYLFGASPALCASFLQGRADPGLEPLGPGTLAGRFATSLRMSDLGYRNSSQRELVVSANSLTEYVRDLAAATRQPRAEFAGLGVKVDGQYRQLNANQLQIENEFYSTIRPKRVTRSGERPTAALRRGGVQYIELRALDISPYDPVGINQRQLRFLEVFLIYCLLKESPPISRDEQALIDRNHHRVARSGRDPALLLSRTNGSGATGEVRLQDWGRDICARMIAVAQLIDPDESLGHVAAVRTQAEVVAEPDATPSARLLADLRASGASLADYGLDLARRTRDYFRALPPELNTRFGQLTTESAESLERQAAIEAADTMDFDTYLTGYLASSETGWPPA
jgi:glutamate--cysteine ligase